MNDEQKRAVKESVRDLDLSTAEKCRAFLMKLRDDGHMELHLRDGKTGGEAQIEDIPDAAVMAIASQVAIQLVHASRTGEFSGEGFVSEDGEVLESTCEAPGVLQ